MRFLSYLFFLIVAALALLGDLILINAIRSRGHRHLAPGTPRSVIESRRMGLA